MRQHLLCRKTPRGYPRHRTLSLAWRRNGGPSTCLGTQSSTGSENQQRRNCSTRNYDSYWQHRVACPCPNDTRFLTSSRVVLQRFIRCRRAILPGFHTLLHHHPRLRHHLAPDQRPWLLPQLLPRRPAAGQNCKPREAHDHWSGFMHCGCLLRRCNP